jgi:class 3 adenylate cyclase
MAGEAAQRQSEAALDAALTALIQATEIHANRPRLVERAVVSVDLSQYGRLSKMLERLHPNKALALHTFNQGILGMFRQVMKQVGAIACETVETGDGAILTFADSAHAVAFAEGVQRQAMVEAKRSKAKGLGRYYRIGISTDKIAVQRHSTATGKHVWHRIAGTAIATAVRLQSASGLGEVIICEETFLKLAESIRKAYGARAPEDVAGKPHEDPIKARRRAVAVPPRSGKARARPPKGTQTPGT